MRSFIWLMMRVTVGTVPLMYLRTMGLCVSAAGNSGAGCAACPVRVRGVCAPRLVRNQPLFEGLRCLLEA